MASRLASILLAVLLAAAGTLASAAPQAGWWWNPAEPGSGVFMELQGPRLFMAGYFYGADGRGTWLVSNDPMPDPNSYDGRLLAFANGQSLVGAYRAPGSPADAGPVSLRFSDPRHASLTWAGRTVPLERFDFRQGADPSFVPKPGWWWNPDESGSGMSIEVQGNRMFFAGFMYDAAGNPAWYVADGPMESPTSFRAPLLRFSGGQTLGGPWRAPQGPVQSGTVEIEFSAANRATLAYSDDGAKAKRVIRLQTVYEAVVSRVTPPERFTGYYEQTQLITDERGRNELIIDAPLITFTRDDLTAIGGGYPAFYKVTSSVLFLTLKQSDTQLPCTGEGSTRTDINGTQLKVNADLTYLAVVGPVTVSIDFVVTCRTSDGIVTTHVPLEQPVQLSIAGTIDAAGKLTGTISLSPAPFITYSGGWEFTPGF